MSYHALVDEKGFVVGVSHDGEGVLALLPGHKLVPADERPWPGQIHVDGVFKTPPPPPPTVTQLKDYAAAVRFKKESVPVVVDGMQIATDRASQGRLGTMLAHIETEPAVSYDFKATNGWFKLDAEGVRAVVKAVCAHVNGCFKAEFDIEKAIVAGKITSFAEIDSAAWPANS